MATTDAGTLACEPFDDERPWETKQRPRFIAALREFADYLDANPAAPVPSSLAANCPILGTDETVPPQIDAIAEALGTEARTINNHRYSTSVEFGPIVYDVYHVWDENYARHLRVSAKAKQLEAEEREAARQAAAVEDLASRAENMAEELNRREALDAIGAPAWSKHHNGFRAPEVVAEMERKDPTEGPAKGGDA